MEFYLDVNNFLEPQSSKFLFLALFIIVCISRKKRGLQRERLNKYVPIRAMQQNNLQKITENK